MHSLNGTGIECSWERSRRSTSISREASDFLVVPSFNILQREKEMTMELVVHWLVVLSWACKLWVPNLFDSLFSTDMHRCVLHTTTMARSNCWSIREFIFLFHRQRVFFTFFDFVCVKIKGTVHGLVMRGLEGPSQSVTRGMDIILHCRYDLEAGDRLYAVKWFHGTREFYRFQPELRPPSRSFPIEDVYVDV
jgi:hypothetical protein